MALAILAVLAGLVALVFGADRFVDGAAALARKFGLPPLLVGMIVIGFGTSMPEILVSATAALGGNAGISLGNAYGSNTTNILLIIGLSAILKPVRVTASANSREIPTLLAVTGLTVFLLYDGTVSRVDAAVMLVVFAASMGASAFLALRSAQTEPTVSDADAETGSVSRDAEQRTAARSAFWVVAGLALMIASSRLLVWGAVQLATHFGISDLIVGLTIVAIGTSLPELASSVIAARKGEDEMALGNIIGSNIFNSLVVVGVAGLITPLTAEKALIHRDIPAMVGATVCLYLFCRDSGGKGNGAGVINRVEGSILLLGYAAYNTYLVLTATAS